MYVHLHPNLSVFGCVCVLCVCMCVRWVLSACVFSLSLSMCACVLGGVCMRGVCVVCEGARCGEVCVYVY